MKSFCCTRKEWANWQWQLKNVIKSGDQLAQYVCLPPDRVREIENVITNEYQGARDEMLLTPYLVSLINWDNPNDPIALQHLPHATELATDEFTFREVWEKDENFLDEARLVQQIYPDIVVLRRTRMCASYCRFCFEKIRTLRGQVPQIGTGDFANAVEIIRTRAEVRQILISGGDPSIMPDKILENEIESLLGISHIVRVRMGTRAPLHNPFRITREFSRMLGRLQRSSRKVIALGVHFNHPIELTPEAILAVRRLRTEGVEVYNQTVLLKGINDNIPTLAELFRKLLIENVSLHYMFHAMPVPRTGHFRTSVRKGQELMRGLRQMGEFRNQLPRYVIAHHTGKQIAEFMHDKFFEDIQDGKRVIRFLSDITHAWEIYPDGLD